MITCYMSKLLLVCLSKTRRPLMLRALPLLVCFLIAPSGPANAQRPKPVWLCESPTGVRGAQDRACPEGYVTLRAPGGVAVPTPTRAPRPVMPALLPWLRATPAPQAPRQVDAAPPRVPALPINPWLPLITTVWTLAGFLVVLLIAIGVLRVLFFKRSVTRIARWLGTMADAHSAAPSAQQSASVRVAPEVQPRSATNSGSSLSRQGRAAAVPSATAPGIHPGAHPIPRHESWSEDLLKALEWRRFERLVERYWQLKGYAAVSTGPGADGGVDVRLPDKQDPAQTFAVIQCKSWATSWVGVEPVRALWGSREHFKAKLAIFYTVSRFSEPAKAFAEGKHLKLVDGATLLQQITSLPERDQQALLSEITRGDYTTPSCPTCETKMVLRAAKGDRSPFWGCPRYPVCKGTTLPYRGA